MLTPAPQRRTLTVRLSTSHEALTGLAVPFEVRDGALYCAFPGQWPAVRDWAELEAELPRALLAVRGEQLREMGLGHLTKALERLVRASPPHPHADLRARDLLDEARNHPNGSLYLCTACHE